MVTFEAEDLGTQRPVVVKSPLQAIVTNCVPGLHAPNQGVIGVLIAEGTVQILPLSDIGQSFKSTGKISYLPIICRHYQAQECDKHHRISA